MLSVTGFVHPGKILANQGLRPGDCLVLTKPLGTGIIHTAIKAGLASPETIRLTTALMAAVNKQVEEVMRSFAVLPAQMLPISVCWAIWPKCCAQAASGVIIITGKVPVLPDALHFAAMGFVPADAHKPAI